MSFVGPGAFALPLPAPVGVCGECVDVARFLPPFKWPSSAAEIEASAAEVLAAADANLKAVAAADPPTFASVIAPLMAPPNYKTNPLVCQSKFLQHCSTDALVRAAAEAAGKQFATFKAAAKTRADVFAKVEAFAATAEAKALGPYEDHYVQAIRNTFRRGGLALSEEKRAELQRLLDADAEACSKYGSNLGADATKLSFSPSELEGLPESFLKERMGDDGKCQLTLKYPDLIPVLGQCEVGATREALTQARECAYENNLELMEVGAPVQWSF